ncbi:MAG: HAMP domain-containing protein [Lachnospiraceae bacterium]|nr:HAMP domain-containing protein [Lachnospiraceae bacterium]
MKKLSIKIKITLWYTLFMTLLVILSLGLLLTVSNTRVLSNTGNRLKNTVIKSFKEVEYRQGSLKIDDDFTALGIEEGIYLSVYDGAGNFLYGRLPSYYNGTASLIMDELQQEYDFYTQWYLYDYLMELEGYGPLWVRGITSQTSTDRMMVTLLHISLIIFPFFLIVISVGGYLIIRRTLSPLDKVTETAFTISQGNDLSRRIHLDKGKDEVHRLAHTFDHMMDRLQAAFEREKQFTSDVSHELRTPTAVILSQCEYALAEDTSYEEQKCSITAIHNQARKISGLISQLLTLARADSGRLMLNKEEINLSQLAQVVCEEQQELAHAKNIQIEQQIEPDLLFSCDETMIMRFFINLLNNAITYGREGGHILLTLSTAGSRIEGSICDDGIGIGPEHLPHIWERFYQADSSRTSLNNGFGAGLGLPMVKWIVEAHDGSITVESTPDVGTIFLFSFPR